MLTTLVVATTLAVAMAPAGEPVIGAAGGNTAGGTDTALASPPTLEALLDDFRALAIDATGIPVRDRRIMLGRVEATLDEGSVHAVRTRSGTIAGILFAGKGTFRYVAQDAAERRLLESSLHRLKRGYVYGSGHLVDRFTELLVVSSFDPLEGDWSRPPGAEGGLPPGTGSVSEHVRSRWTERIAKAMDLNALDQDCAAARLNAGDFVSAAFEGGPNKYVHTWDRASLFAGHLLAWDSKAKGFSQVSEFWLPGDERGEPAIARLTDLRLDVETSDNLTGTIAGDLTLRMARNGVRAVPLDLVSHRDARARGPTSDKRTLALRTLTDGDGAALQHAHRRHRLLVMLPAPRDRGDAVHLRFGTEGEVFAVPGREDEYVSLEWAPWYPDPVTRSLTGFTYSIRIRTRAPLVPVVAGIVRSLRVSGESVDLEVEAEVPKRVLPVVAGDFRTREIRAGSVPLRVSLPGRYARTLVDLPEEAGAILGYLERTIGPYPEEALAIAATTKDRRSGILGVGYPGMVLLAPSILKCLENGEPYGREVLAHELAHQWFGLGGFTIGSNSEGWLFQSAAEYYASLALDALWGKESVDYALPSALKHWRSAAFEGRKAGSMETAFQARDLKAQSRTWLLVSGRGPLILHMLRGTVGDDRFFEIMRRFLARAGETEIGTTDLLAQVAGEVMGQDMGWFFDQWVRDAGIPRVEISRRIEETAAGATTVVGEAVQRETSVFKRLSIPIAMTMEDGTVENRIVVQDDLRTGFRFELPGRPVRIEIDPLHETLATYSRP